MRYLSRPCFVFFHAVVFVRAERRVRGVVEDDSQWKRNLKKGNDDDYYFGIETREPKTVKRSEDKLPLSNSPASSPTTSPQQNIIEVFGVGVSVDSNEPRSEKKSQTTKKIKKSSTDEKTDITSKGKGKGKRGDVEGEGKGDDVAEVEVTGKGKGKGASNGKGVSNDGGKGKGKGSSGKGKGRGGAGLCSHPVASEILDAVPNVVTRNPDKCCHNDDSIPITVYITHALQSENTFSGFELFWDEIYNEIERTSFHSDVCFVMTGVAKSESATTMTNTTLGNTLVQVNKLVSEIPQVASMMVTDPTMEVDLITEVRRISDSPLLPSIGVFNAGYNNVIIESIISGKGRLPYVGYLNDSDYGKEAGRITVNLLNGVAGKPLCLNARIGELDFLGERCAAYYDQVSNITIVPEFGVECSLNSTASDIISLLSQKGANAVWAPLECCAVTAEATATVRSTTGRNIVVGCQDGDAGSDHPIDFITQQPISLQAYSTASWASFPVVQGKEGRDSRGIQYFPSLQSLVNTAIFNSVVV